MKIRNGYVSNSSSSSFILNKPGTYIPLTKVAEFYEIDKRISPEIRDWLSLLIWVAINNEDFSINRDDLYNETSVEGDNLAMFEVNDHEGAVLNVPVEITTSLHKYSDKFFKNDKKAQAIEG